jgi:Fe-S-cluster containining protein
MSKSPRTQVDIDDIDTWVKYKKHLCKPCDAGCCGLPVEAKSEDLIRMGLMNEFELEDNLKHVARRLIKSGVIEHFHSRSATFTLSRMANGDCLYLDQKSRLCTIYTKRPDTCRNHPQIGPRPGYCAFSFK